MNSTSTTATITIQTPDLTSAYLGVRAAGTLVIVIVVPLKRPWVCRTYIGEISRNVGV